MDNRHPDSQALRGLCQRMGVAVKSAGARRVRHIPPPPRRSNLKSSGRFQGLVPTSKRVGIPELGKDKPSSFQGLGKISETFPSPGKVPGGTRPPGAFRTACPEVTPHLVCAGAEPQGGFTRTGGGIRRTVFAVGRWRCGARRLHFPAWRCVRFPPVRRGARAPALRWALPRS